MTKTKLLQSFARTNAIVVAAILATSAFIPLLMQGRAGAATIQNRYIDMSSTLSSSPASPSLGSGRDGGDAAGQNVTYTVGFDMPATGNVDAIVVEFCDDANGGPIVLQACTPPTGLDVDTSTSDPVNQVGISGFTKTTGGIVEAANRYGIENGTPQSITSNTANTTVIDGRTYAASDVKFDITGVVNPTVLGTFFARIIVYDDNTNLPTTSWVSTATGNNGIGTRVHDGGVALSVANHLTVTARVQEVLEFCIGTDDDSIIAGLDGGPGARVSADDCSVVQGTDLDLGVVESGTIQKTSDGDILNDGVAMVRTNAIDGVAIFYKAEIESGISVANGGGALRQAGINDCTTIAAVNNACFNSAGGNITDPAQTAMSAGTELFGMTLTNQDESAGGNTTNALVCDVDYNGDGSCGAGAATGYAWDPTGAFDIIAASTGPVDDEMVNLEFAATASTTTPTGLYTVTANFVATSQF